MSYGLYFQWGIGTGGSFEIGDVLVPEDGNGYVAGSIPLAGKEQEGEQTVAGGRGHRPER